MSTSLASPFADVRSRIHRMQRSEVDRALTRTLRQVPSPLRRTLPNIPCSTPHLTPAPLEFF